MAFDALLTRIGFNVAQATAIANEGIQEPEGLVTYNHSDIKTFFKHLARRGVYPPFGAQHKFQILCYRVEKQTPLGLGVTSDLFDSEKMKAATDEREEQRLSITGPSAFKRDTKWRVRKEQFLNYMGTMYGQCKAPLSFVLRPEDDPADEEDLTDDFERMIYLTPHHSQCYQYDTGLVYDELKALLVNSTAFTWIRVHD